MPVRSTHRYSVSCSHPGIAAMIALASAKARSNSISFPAPYSPQGMLDNHGADPPWGRCDPPGSVDGEPLLMRDLSAPECIRSPSD